MVKVREALPEREDGSVDLKAWLARYQFKAEEAPLLQAAGELALLKGATVLTPYQDSCFRHGLETAEVLIPLELDAPTLAACMLYFCAAYANLCIEDIEKACGPAVAKLVRGLQQIDSTQSHATGTAWSQQMHRDNIRRMLLAVVEDVRVVLMKLAAQVSALRAAKNLTTTAQRKIAQETRDIFAPLANRLGIGQIKWELEDFAFRYLEPDAYKNIAKLLDEKRMARESYIAHVVKTIQEALAVQGVEADVYGRAKHIFSIWRKMQRKKIGFGDVYDVRAVRLMVHEVKDCYAALGVIHTLWQHIPKEFDDYIASPKENGYRSLHTAVVGPEGKTLEVQIRTVDMHQEAELGVAAHWVYKEEGKADDVYRHKLASLRQILDWQEEVDTPGVEADALSTTAAELFDDRVYVFTPRGDVVDLPQSATPLDFAYHIHSQVGHRCRGAKVNGKIVPLTHHLKSGDQIEIMTSKQEAPSRDWLNPNAGYLRSSRAKAKVQSWFRQQNRAQNITAGHEMLEKELKRLNLQVNLQKIAHKLSYPQVEDLYAALGNGDCKLTQVLSTISRLMEAEVRQYESPLKATPSKNKHGGVGDVTIAGIGNLVCHFAKCCKPVPGDDIIGYITVGRGVTVHRESCHNVIEEQEKPENRLIQVEWQTKASSTFPVDVGVLAYDRHSLLNDITAILSRDKVNVLRISTKTEGDAIARMKLTLEISNLQQLGKVLTQILQLPNVIEAFRIRQD